jgi:CheY-like chemotaxis protein
MGIAPEDQARIFDAFVQVGGKRTRKGTGLGLSITRHFVELLGGTIQVESTPGQGSRFRVELPAEVAAGSEVKAESADLRPVLGLEPGQPEYRILVVEDHRENRLLLKRLLETIGLHARVAEDGAEGVESFQTWRPHFIWMDVRLPVLSGFDATRRIRDLEGGRAVKIVALTSSAFVSEREGVMAAGFDDFLRKPYRPREIFDCMAMHLGIRYVYGEVAGPSVNDVPATLRPEDLALLPAALLNELETALLSLDPTRVALIVSRISDENPSLGKALGRFADKLAYSPILSALKSCKSPSTEADTWQS